MKVDCVRRWTRAAQVFALFAGLASCSEQGSTGPIASGHARLDIAPRFATVPGAPAVPLSRIQGSLSSSNGTTVTQTANFVDGSASLTFDVAVSGTTIDVTLDLVGFDVNDAEAYRAHQLYTLKPGPNDDLTPPVLQYSGPDAGVTALHFDPGSMTLDPGGTTRISVTGTGANNTPISSVRVGWTSRNTGVATVDDAGNVTAGQVKGQTYIVARTPANFADSLLVTTRGAIAAVVPTPTSISLFRGATGTVSAEVRDPSGTVISDRPATFTSSDEKVATVTAAGVVTAVAVGSTSITAAAGDKSASVPVTVTSPVAGVQLTQSSVTLQNIGDSQALTATVLAKAGASVSGVTPAFTTSDATVATVAANGRVTAAGYGSATITATIESFTATTTVAVVGPLAVSPATPTIFTNAAQQFSVTAGGKGPFTWKVNDVVGGNTSVGTISASGSYKAPAQVPNLASFDICATQASPPAPPGCTHVTIASPVAGIQLAPPTVILAHLGDVQQLTATILPKTGASVAGLTPTFTTSDATVATVGTDGRVTAVGWGTATITATIETFAAPTTVNVVGQLVVAPATPTIYTNATQQFSVTSGGKGPFTWKVNDVAGGNASVGTISASGSYTPPAQVPNPASFDICASQASPAAPPGCTHVTIASPVAGIQLAPPTVALAHIGDSELLTATILPKAGASVAGLTPTFTTSDASVATVGTDGRVTAAGWGTAIITATIESYAATTTVNVVGPLVLSPPTADKLPNGTQQFTVLSGGKGPFTWTVNDIAGGNSTYGTITADGLYTAPSSVPSPASFRICAAQASPPTQPGCVTMTIDAVPPAGADIVVLNDVNLFDVTALQDVNNQRLIGNLVTFSGTGARASQTGVMLYVGHGSLLPPNPALFGAYAIPNYTVTVVNTASIASIPATYKVIALWAPTVAFSTAEINALKQFAAEGGRIVFLGESADVYSMGITVENSLLSSMGAQMTNNGGSYDCSAPAQPYQVIPGSQLVTTHQVMSGLTQLTLNCASEIIPGPNDFVLFRSSDGAHVLGGVAKIDVTPLQSGNARMRTVRP